MKRTAVALLLIFAWTCCLSTSAFAHPTAPEHYEELEAVIFNNRWFSSTLSGDELRNIHIIEYASTLCIDQFGETGGTLLNGLRDIWHIPGMPADLTVLNPDETHPLSATNHRFYTHRGWDYSYTGVNGDRANWPARKSILLSSVNKVFNFGFFAGNWGPINFGYSEKCNSFSALVYYIHVLGDYLEDVSPKVGNVGKFNGTSNGRKIPFASISAPNTPDIFSEITKHLKTLFAGQRETSNYQTLLSSIDNLANRSRSFVGSMDGTILEEQYSEISAYVQELMNILTGENGQFNYIHALMMEEDFFREAFPSMKY